ncbi:MAG: lysophospholipase, partial [Promethearchaeota archaeon]
KWVPDKGDIKACIQIVHGLAEHAGRYEDFAKFLTDNGFICYANDHQGHGKTAGDESKLGLISKGGWDSMVKDLKLMTDKIKEENLGKPVFYFGHSLGSLLGQAYIQNFGGELKGAILSGSSGRQSFIVQNMGIFLSKLMVKLKGADTPSDLAYNLTFKAYNKKFEPSPTGTDFDWLNRDENAVKDYVKDPYCGFKMSNAMALEISKGLKEIWKPENEKRIPKDLPILFLSGTDDSTNMFLKNLEPLIKRYKEKYGIQDVEYKFYDGARHELLSELNKDKVLQDILSWLNAHL